LSTSNGGSGGGPSGGVLISTGNALFAGSAAGGITLVGGDSNGAATGGGITLNGGDGGDNDGRGGQITFQAGAAGATNAIGGAINIAPGAGAGTGAAGLINLNGTVHFPTTSPAPSISAAGSARMFFNGTALQLSQNAGAYSSIGSPTQDAWFPAETSANYMTSYRVRTIGATGVFNFDFRVPHDFNSIVSLVMICAPNATFGAAGAIDLESEYGAAGESVTNHNETDSLTGLSGTADVWQEIDISSVFTALAAGDYCGVDFSHISGISTTVNYLGIRLRYN